MKLKSSIMNIVHTRFRVFFIYLKKRTTSRATEIAIEGMEPGAVDSNGGDGGYSDTPWTVSVFLDHDLVDVIPDDESVEKPASRSKLELVLFR